MLINATQTFLGNKLLNQWGEMEKSDVCDFHSTFDNLASEILTEINFFKVSSSLKAC